MIEHAPQKNENLYTYKGNTYELLFFAKMQIGDQWLPCAVYQNNMGGRFVREIIDFAKKFEKI